MTEHFGRDVRTIVTRLIVHGTLELQTPALFGNGDAEGPVDLMVLRDSISDRALLTGSTLAGALRAYLRRCEYGYNGSEQAGDAITQLFGGLKEDDNGSQSPLIIADALSDTAPMIELRDGVRINSAMGTADRGDQTDDGRLRGGAKYDLELLAAGTRFPLRFELLVQADDDVELLKEALARALTGLEQGHIALGMKKRRGFGTVQVDSWTVWEFDMRVPQQMQNWLLFGRDSAELHTVQPRTGPISQALAAPRPTSYQRCRLEATFSLPGSLIIRAGQESGGLAPDVVHLHSRQLGSEEPQPIISGTSWAGVLRHRAERIVRTINPQVEDGEKQPKIIECLFGNVAPSSNPNDARLRGEAKQSRLITHESVIKQARTDLVQSRIAIDRFTGGVYPGALFNEQPVWGTSETRTTLRVEVDQPSEYEVGLLLLLLKDLWTGDVAVGGERSIGRGTLQGVEAHVHYNDQYWSIKQDGAQLQIDGPAPLQPFVDAFVNAVGGAADGHTD